MFLLILIGLFNVTSGQPLGETTDKVNHFKEGEVLEFKLSYGWFTVGKASAQIADQPISFNGKSCYKVEVGGSTAGLIGAFTDVNDHWGAYVDQNSLKPVHAYKQIQEGNYERIAKTNFDYDEGRVVVEKYNPKKDIRKPADTFQIKTTDWDFLSAYLNMRNIDFTKLKKGDSIRVNAFYEKQFYDLILEYDGKVSLKSKVGTLWAHKLNLIMQANEIFPEERGIVAYVSADKNQLPLRIEAEMFFGKAYCDLVSYRNIKYGLDFQ